MNKSFVAFLTSGASSLAISAGLVARSRFLGVDQDARHPHARQSSAGGVAIALDPANDNAARILGVDTAVTRPARTPE